MASHLILFSKPGFELIPYFLWSIESINMEQQLPGDVDAHVAKIFIKPIHMLRFFSILLKFDFSFHGHPV